jgi:hypothetical protein
MSRPDIIPPKTLVVIAGDNRDLAYDVATHLLADHAKLLQGFNKSSRLTHGQVTSHQDEDASAQQIMEALQHVLVEQKGNNLMILTGFKDTADWAAAIEAFSQRHPLSITLLAPDAARPKDETLRLFHHSWIVPEETDADGAGAIEAIRNARHYATALRQDNAPAAPTLN